jgi:hypothetical protein
MQCLEGSAKELAKSFGRPLTYLDFKKRLIDPYWGEEKQRIFESQLHSTKYEWSAEKTMKDHFIQFLNRARHLTPQRSDETIIKAIIRHFPHSEEYALTAARVKEVPQVLEMLERFVILAAEQAAVKKKEEDSRAAAAAARSFQNRGPMRSAGVNVVQQRDEENNNTNFQGYRGRGGYRSRGYRGYGWRGRGQNYYSNQQQQEGARGQQNGEAFAQAPVPQQEEANTSAAGATTAAAPSSGTSLPPPQGN